MPHAFYDNAWLGGMLGASPWELLLFLGLVDSIFILLPRVQTESYFRSVICFRDISNHARASMWEIATHDI